VIAVIFEARPRTERRPAYLDTAERLWRDEAAGRRSIFADYRLRVARVLRDYGMHERDQAPAQ
jgi:hypothetical protein